MAKKSKGFSELLKQQQGSSIHQKGMDELQKKVEQSPLSNQFEGIIENPKGAAKMSDVLEAFVEPYLDFTTNLQEREKLFSIAVVAWNLTLMPEQTQKAGIDKIIQTLPRNDRQAQKDTREIIAELMERKQQFFANNHRYIVEFHLQTIGNRHHLSVASTLPE